MNEQIEKLIIEAFFDESTSIESQKMYTFGEEKMQKFAELIVQECAGIYDRIDNGNQHQRTDDYLLALQRTFFGVEE